MTLKEMREAAGFKSQDDAAAATGLHQGTISVLERGGGDRGPTIHTIDKLAEHYKRTRDEVIAAIAESRAAGDPEAVAS